MTLLWSTWQWKTLWHSSISFYAGAAAARGRGFLKLTLYPEKEIKRDLICWSKCWSITVRLDHKKHTELDSKLLQNWKKNLQQNTLTQQSFPNLMSNLVSCNRLSLCDFWWPLQSFSIFPESKVWRKRCPPPGFGQTKKNSEPKFPPQAAAVLKTRFENSNSPKDKKFYGGLIIHTSPWNELRNSSLTCDTNTTNFSQM